MTRTAIFVLLLTVMGLCPALAHDAKPNPHIRITGTYSDLYFNEEGGDLLGTEIRIVMARDHFQGTIQIAEGSASEIGVFDLTENHGKITFDVPVKGYEGTFVGKITGKKLIGILTFKTAGMEPLKLSLPRKRSYWE